MLMLFMVSPEGYPQYTSVVVAEDDEDARAKAIDAMPEVEKLVSHGVRLNTLNLTHFYDKKGYTISVIRKGLYH